jgi:hypothetical protein
MTPDALWTALNHPSRHGTSQSTIDAVIYGVKARVNSTSCSQS